MFLFNTNASRVRGNDFREQFRSRIMYSGLDELFEEGILASASVFSNICRRKGMKDRENLAIVLGGSSVTSLGICRNLGENGVSVSCVDNRKNETAFSRFCAGFFAIPGIESSSRILKSFLSELDGRVETSPVMFPASDLFCLNLVRTMGEIGGKYVFLANRQSVETLVDKEKFYLSLMRAELPHPETYFPLEEDLNEIERNLDYPVLVKPAVSQMFSRIFILKSFVAKDRKELEKYLGLASEHRIPVMVQQIIPGPPTNVYGIAGYVDRNSEPKGVFAYRRIRDWPLGFGCNSLIESIPVSAVEQIKEITLNYLRSLKYTGLFEAEFKRDDRDGAFKLIEINARSWWQNRFATVCGSNLVLMAYLDAMGRRIPSTETYRTGIRWICALNDIQSAMTLFQSGSVGFLEWLSSYKSVVDYAYFAPNDPLPCISNLFLVSHAYFRGFLSARKISDQSAPIERSSD